jgi:hypothetical protein
MRRSILVLVPLLGGCSDGRDREFTPSEDLAATHPWLAGTWVGTTTYQGVEYPASVTVETWDAPEFWLRVVTTRRR